MKYSPNGALFASAGFDGKVFLYDGTSSELVAEVGSPAHNGGVYGVRRSISTITQKFELGLIEIMIRLLGNPMVPSC